MNNWDTWNDGWFHGLKCPVCGHRLPPTMALDRCPGCGAEMEDAE